MNKSKYRMLICGLSSDRGGVESYIMNMAKHLSPDKFDCYFPANGAEITYGEDIKALGGHFIEVPRGRGWRFLSYYWGWYKVLRRFRFDVLYWNDCSIVALGVLRMARRLGVPVRVFHAHNASADYELSGIRKVIERRNFKDLPQIANFLLACSEPAAKWMFREGAPYRVIPNAVDVSQYAFSNSIRNAKKQELGLSDRLLIGFIGRMTAQKYPEYFVKIAAEIGRRVPQALCLMVGIGELESHVKQLAEDSGLSPFQFLMLGARSDVPELLQALDCLVMPSRYEGLPMALVEAQTSGLPCVVSDAISRECDLTGSLTFLPLDAPVGQWADTILQRLDAPGDRRLGAAKVRAAGFDAATSFAELEQLLLSQLPSPQH